MIYLSYLWLLLQHKWFVLVAGLRVGGIPLYRLIIHDWSKFSRAEFGAYARNTAVRQGKQPRTEATDLEFGLAWLHHENRNPHHWGYWIPRSGKFANRPLAMPATYIREMVADWLGAGRAYEHTWDMTNWLLQTLSGMLSHMHKDTAVAVLKLLREIGYGAVVDSLNRKEAA
jgi:hypothetical protein